MNVVSQCIETPAFPPLTFHDIDVESPTLHYNMIACTPTTKAWCFVFWLSLDEDGRARFWHSIDKVGRKRSPLYKMLSEVAI